MSDLQQLVERNQAFATDYTNNLNLLPRFNTVIISCVDSRIDPAHFLNLDPGDALVFRTAGARITDSIIMDIGVLWNMLSMMLGKAPELELVIIQHTDCGYERLASPEIAAGIGERLGISAETIQSMNVTDHTT